MFLEEVYGESGKPRSLSILREEYGIAPYAHTALGDAQATHMLFAQHRAAAKRRRASTLAQLVAPARKNGLGVNPMSPEQFPTHVPDGGLKRSRSALGLTDLSPTDAYAQLDYCRELLVALADLEITPDEREHLDRIAHARGLSPGVRRAFHAQALAFHLTATQWDGIVDEREVEDLAKMVECLRQLGWAPGDRPSSDP
jgi:hypothetical protein